MSEIHIFSDVEEAINILKNYNKSIKKCKLSKEYIIRKSVSSNIFRAFHHLDKNPSLIYRKWASNNLNSIIDELKEIKTKEDFDNKLFSWINLFIEYWASQVKNKEQRIIFGPASKMLNLLLKVSNESEYITNNKIQELLHVPFDEYTLKPLIRIINEITDVNYRIDIPKNPTMKYISNPQLYLIVQNAVFRLCQEASIDPILYDYWCWNEKH